MFRYGLLWESSGAHGKKKKKNTTTTWSACWIMVAVVSCWDGFCIVWTWKLVQIEEIMNCENSRENLLVFQKIQSAEAHMRHIWLPAFNPLPAKDFLCNWLLHRWISLPLCSFHAILHYLFPVTAFLTAFQTESGSSNSCFANFWCRLLGSPESERSYCIII